jgi:hypothetical protein
VGRCADVGHLWLDGVDPVPWLAQAQERLRVVHLHGVGECDHMALSHTPPTKLDAVVRQLFLQDFRGILTQVAIIGERILCHPAGVSLPVSTPEIGSPWARHDSGRP